MMEAYNDNKNLQLTIDLTNSSFTRVNLLNECKIDFNIELNKNRNITKVKAA